MKRLFQYFARENRRRLQRDTAILLGFTSQLIMTMLIAICAMGCRYPDQGLFISLLIVASLWLQVAIALLIHFKNKIWPTKLMFSTSMMYIAGGFTLMLQGNTLFEHQAWVLFFYWFAAAFVVVMSSIETLKYDFGISLLWRR